MTDEDLDRIERAEEIQRYTENRCEALEKENTELKKNKEVADKQLIKAKELLGWFVWYFEEGRPNLVPYKDKLIEVEQFLRLIECQ